jgi:hypothetical protein
MAAQKLKHKAKTNEEWFSVDFWTSREEEFDNGKASEKTLELSKKFDLTIA